MMPKHIGVAADHGESELKEYRVRMLREVGYEVTNFGDRHHTRDDDYPDFGVPLCDAAAGGKRFPRRLAKIAVLEHPETK